MTLKMKVKNAKDLAKLKLDSRTSLVDLQLYTKKSENAANTLTNSEIQHA